MKIQKIGDSEYLRENADGTLKTIVTPAANVNGIRVFRAEVFANAGETERLMYKASAPTSQTDAAAISVLRSTTSSVSWLQKWIDREFVIPPGFGLYEQASGAAVSTGAFVNYELL